MFGCTSFTYNWVLALQQKHYEENKRSLSRTEIQDQLVALKKQDEFSWHSKFSQTLLSSLLHLYTAFTNFFKGLA
ncbi:helix-turn-helix domain-containing protein [Acinetobacter sp. ANC 5414]|uniref:helix-turn-helix domain-containing protein n=1 Tax=Acinetobacter sp. ANC 5414 TaxID=2731251 RepID=UPI00331F9221